MSSKLISTPIIFKINNYLNVYDLLGIILDAGNTEAEIRPWPHGACVLQAGDRLEIHKLKK